VHNLALIFELPSSHPHFNMKQCTQNEKQTYGASMTGLLSFPLGVTMGPEAEMTAHSQH